jgi:eukaryotic-like serine/threonine-protein kinase
VSPSPPGEVLPVIVADLQEDALEVLVSAAASGAGVFVPLLAAPINADLHVLEVYTPSRSDPVVFRAEPLGPPTEDGFPLRLEDARTPRSEPPRHLSWPPDSRPSHAVRSKSGAPQPPLHLSASHTRDLSQVGPLPRDPDEALEGRALADGALVLGAAVARRGPVVVHRGSHRRGGGALDVMVVSPELQNDLDFCRRFHAEALAASRLEHPSIARVVEFGQEPDGLLFVAAEHAEGSPLSRLPKGERTGAAGAGLMAQVCGALAYAHASGVVHGAIGPEIVVVRRGDHGEPAVTLVGFGVPGAADPGADVASCGSLLETLAGADTEVLGLARAAMGKDRGRPAPSMSELSAALAALSATPPGGEPVRLSAPPPAPPREAAPPAPPPLPPRRPPPVPAARRPPPVPPARPAAAAPPLRLDLPAEPAEASRRGEPATSTWLEHGAQVGGGRPSGAGRLSAGELVAGSLASNGASWIEYLWRTPDLRVFAERSPHVEPAIRSLAANGDVRTLWAVANALNTVAMDGAQQGSGSRAAVASGILRVFADPAILSVVGERVLGSTEDYDEGRRLLLQAGVAGAYGLYGARVKAAGKPAARAPFVAVLKDFGIKAWPVIRAALEKISANLSDPRAHELAEDLLLCAPAAGDESAGHVIVRFLRVDVSAVNKAATAAIVKLWGDRARPLLLGLLQSREDSVRLAALAGLRQLRAVDEHVVPRIHAMLTRRVPAGVDLRVGAAMALAHVTEMARQPALSLLAEILRAKSPLRAPHPASTVMPREDAVVLAAAQSFVHLRGPSPRALIAERAARSNEPLRTQLRQLLDRL